MSRADYPDDCAFAEERAYPGLKPPLKSSRLISRRQSDVEILRVVESIEAGNLSDRAQLAGFEGPDRELLEGVNRLLDALARPLTAAAARLAQLAKGELPPKITTACTGDFMAMKDNLNSCIDSLAALSLELKRVSGVRAPLDQRHGESR